MDNNLLKLNTFIENYLYCCGTMKCVLQNAGCTPLQAKITKMLRDTPEMRFMSIRKQIEIDIKDNKHKCLYQDLFTSCDVRYQYLMDCLSGVKVYDSYVDNVYLCDTALAITKLRNTFVD
ncbi:hypothetical protein [Vibrio phage vB_VibM_83AMN]|nr:hypothetical protein [Vibrio phage vB_VibM_83AMN]